MYIIYIHDHINGYMYIYTEIDSIQHSLTLYIIIIMEDEKTTFKTPEEEKYEEEQNYIPTHHSHKFDIVKRKNRDSNKSFNLSRRRHKSYDDETLIVSRTIERKTSPSRRLDHFDGLSYNIFPDSTTPAEHGTPRKFVIFLNSLALCDITLSDYNSGKHPYLIINEHAKIDDTLIHIFNLKMNWNDTIASIVRAGYHLYDVNHDLFSKYNLVNTVKIFSKRKIYTNNIPNQISSEEIVNGSRQSGSLVKHLGRKYETFGGKHLPFLRCKKHHRRLDTVFVTGLTIGADTIGLTNEYILLGACNSPYIELEGFLSNIDGNVCNLDPRAPIDESNRRCINRGYSITLTATSKQINKKNTMSISKKNNISLFIDFVLNYLMKDDVNFATIVKKLKTRHVYAPINNRLKASTILAYLSGSDLQCVSD